MRTVDFISLIHALDNLTCTLEQSLHNTNMHSFKINIQSNPIISFSYFHFHSIECIKHLHPCHALLDVRSNDYIMKITRHEMVSSHQALEGQLESHSQALEHGVVQEQELPTNFCLVHERLHYHCHCHLHLDQWFHHHWNSKISH